MKWFWQSTIAFLLLAVPAVDVVRAQTNANSTAASAAEPGNKLIGREVRNPAGQRLGAVKDVAVDLSSGRVLCVLVSVGGFLGLGDRLAAVPPGAFAANGSRLRLDADKQKLLKAPQYKSMDDLRDAGFIATAYRQFDQPTWWSHNAALSFDNAALLTQLFGMNVKDVSGQRMGELNNLAIDLAGGRIACAIFWPDRTLNLAKEFYALPPNALTLSPDSKSLSTGVDRDKLAGAPHFPRDKWPEMTWAWASAIYQHYGKQAYFENGQIRPTSRTNAPSRIYHDANDGQ
jgi:sporulation protein YlmC with PRC-barrel domain